MSAINFALISPDTPRSRTRISIGQVLVHLLRTGLRSNEDNPPRESEDGCYASLLLFIWLSSLSFAMSFSSLTTGFNLSVSTGQLLSLVLLMFNSINILYFIKTKSKWTEPGAALHEMHDNTTERDVIELRNMSDVSAPFQVSTTCGNKKHTTSNLSLFGVFIFASFSLIMFTADIIQVATCLPFFHNEYSNDLYIQQDIIYIVVRTFSNMYICIKIAFMICFKNIKFVSSVWFCYSILLYVALDFVYMIEGLMYTAFVRLNITAPWDSRDQPDTPTSRYDSLCYNKTRAYDDVVFAIQNVFYPFTIEFYILSIGIFLHYWFNASLPTKRSRIVNGYGAIVNDDAVTNRRPPTVAEQQDEMVHYSSTIPLAIVMSLLLLGSSIFLQFDQLLTVVYIYHTIRIIYKVLMIIPVVLGVGYLSYLSYDRKPSLDGSEKLLFGTVTATFLTTAFTALTSSLLLHQFSIKPAADVPVSGKDGHVNVTVEDSVICLVYSIINYFQVAMQTCFFISARRRQHPLASHVSTVSQRRLRECFLYLAICNAFILLSGPFKLISVEVTNVWYFGERQWSIIESLLFPIEELYYFHSVLLCSELYLFFKVE